MPFTVVVLGGYGNFGTLICQRLATLSGIDLIVCGRDRERRNALAARLGARAEHLDIDDPDLGDRLRQLRAQFVISTVGPFQGQDYRVARAAIAARAHYADLADARTFVSGIAALNEEALRNGVLVTSGASSVPALASAVIDEALPQFSRLDKVHHGIASSEKTPGAATVAAVLGYCGKPVRQWRNGQWFTAHGWQDLVAHRFPAPLGRRWLANCDIPDLDIFPARYPSLCEVRFSAGLGLRVTQFGTWLLSWLVRAGAIRNAAPMAAVLRWCSVRLEVFGDGRSGMFVELRGLDLKGEPKSWLWELVAEDNDGPNIPCMAAVALARKLASGTLTVRGAMPCVGMLSLNEYLAELEGFNIRTSQKTWIT